MVKGPAFFVALLLLSGSALASRQETVPQSASATPTNNVLPSGNLILVDLEHATVGGIVMRQDGKTLLAKLGNRVVTKTTEMLEGDPNDMYVVHFGTHEVYRHWNAFSFTDKAFRTSTGLGVGSTVDEFEGLYGEGKLGCEEGCSISFRKSGRANFSILADKYVERGQAGYGAIVAKELWVW